MAAYLPYLVQAAEALLAGLAVGYSTYEGTHDLRAALIAGFGGLVAKALPSQVAPSPKA